MMLPQDLNLFEFSISSLLASLFFGIIGFWLFREGRRRNHFKILIIGIVLIAYPYFTASAAADWVIGIVLCGLAYLVWE